MRVATVCIRASLALAAGMISFFLIHAIFVYGAMAIDNKDVNSGRFAELDGLIGLPVSSLGALLTTYSAFHALTFWYAKLWLRR